MPVVAFRPESSSAAFLAPKYESSRVPARLKKKKPKCIFPSDRKISANISLHQKPALPTIPSTGNFGLSSYIWVKLQLAENLGFTVETVGKLLIFLSLPSGRVLEARTWHAMNSRGWILVTATDKNKYIYIYKVEGINSPTEISDIVHIHILRYIAGQRPKNLQFVKAKILFQAWFCWTWASCAEIKDKLTRALSNGCVTCTT